MTLQANLDPAANISLPLFGIGALFASRRAQQPSWTYQPPSLRSKEPPDPAPHPHTPVSSVTSPTHSEPSPQPVSPSTYRTNSNRVVWGANGQEKETEAAERVHPRNSGQNGIEGQVHPCHASLSRHAVPNAIESSPADVNTRFEEFRSLVDGTSPDTHDTPWDSFLTITYLMCCPTTSDAGRFCLMVTRHLLETPWREKYVAQLISQPCVRLPDVSSSDGLELLQLLEKHFLAPSLAHSLPVRLVYERLAEQVQSVSNLSSRPSSSMAESAKGLPVDHDLNLRLLIRGCWRSALSDPALQNGRRHPANNTRSSLSPSTVSLLNDVSHRLTTPDLAHRLRRIWQALKKDASKAPQQLSNLMAACITDHSKISMALDLLETVPQIVLRDWIAAMSTARIGDRPVPQLGRGSPLYLKMWFELLYRLDTRSYATMSDRTSMCQYAFEQFASAFFHHDYPPFTLVAALQYALLRHRSFDGSASGRLIDYVESSTLISAQRDYKGIPLNGLLAELMSDLDKRSLPNHGVLELLVPYIHEHQNFYAITNLLKRLCRRKTKLSDATFLVTYTSQVFEEIKGETDGPRLGFNIACFSLLLKAQAALDVTTTEARARLETLQSRRFFSHVLDRAQDARIVPLAYHDLTPDLSKEAQTDIIHQFAHQYAMDRTRTIKQNWRSINYLYVYLRKHRLPIRPMFTQALVSACITRPLAENRFVPQKFAVWICRLVGQVEGEAVATQVEHYFWAWRGDLILEAKRELIRLGVYDIARVEIMDRLKLMKAARRRDGKAEKGGEPGGGLSEDDSDTQE